MSEFGEIHRALVQKLESLHRAGVRSMPRIHMPARVAATPAAASATPASARSADAAVEAPRQPNAPIREAASATIAANERPAVLTMLAEEVAKCVKCPELVRTRKQTVFGVGNPNSRLVFFGEAPGADEDLQGEPFVGKAGQLLTKIIEACKLRREDVYIMNVLKCRPPRNRNPIPEEAENCRPFFEKQFDIIRPEFICCLGAIATKTILDTTEPIGHLRGRFHDWRGVRVVATYHPAYLLRNPAAKKLVWADMKMLMKEMGIQL